MTKKKSSVVLPQHVDYCLNVLVTHLNNEPYPEPDFPNAD